MSVPAGSNDGHARPHAVDRLVDVDDAELVARGIGDVVDRQGHLAEELLADAGAPRPGVGHLAIGAVDARVAVERRCRRRPASRSAFSTAWPAGESRATPGLPAVSVIMSGISTRLAFGLAALIEIDGNSVLTPLCLQRQVVHHRQVGVELADAAADDGAPGAARRPTRARRAARRRCRGSASACGCPSADPRLSVTLPVRLHLSSTKT